MRSIAVLTSALIIGAATAVLLSSGGAALAQSATEYPDNDTLLEAYKRSISDASHGRYVDASYGLLNGLGMSEPQQLHDPDVFDQWAQVMSAMTGSPTFNPARGADFQVPSEQVEALRSATTEPALRAIIERARETRIVILDENHLDPRGRAFGLDVARALRPLGYTVLAMEALKRDADDASAQTAMAKLASDGYPRQASGYYLNDPVFADFLRQSLKLGYRPVSYETIRSDYSDDPIEAQAQRELDQAETLVRRAVEAYPDAKILVYVGEHHAAERPIALEGGKVALMAERLKRLTGIDPLTVDQAGLSPVPMNRPDVDLHSIAATKPEGESIVLMQRQEPLVVGLLAGSVDLQVVHPPVAMARGRPDWLAAMGRSPSPIPDDLLPTSGARLIQAFLAGEPGDAIPVDQVIVSAGQTPAALMLPDGPIRYAVQDAPESVH